MSKVQKKINLSVLSQLPEDFSMLGSYFGKYEQASVDLAAEYERYVQDAHVSEDAFKISLYYLDCLIDWQQDFEKAAEVIQYMTLNFDFDHSYHSGIFLRNKAVFEATHETAYKAAILDLLQANICFEKSPYKAENFRVQTLLAENYFETDARAEALQALGQAQRYVANIASPEYLTAYYFIAARLNFEARHYRDALHYLARAKESACDTVFQERHIDILFSCLEVECWVELGEKNKADGSLKAVKKQYQSLYAAGANLFSARILMVQAKLSILRHEIFSASDYAQQSVTVFEKGDLSQDNLYFISALEVACDAYCLVGAENEARAICEKLIKKMSVFAYYPGESIRVQKAQNILESL